MDWCGIVAINKPPGLTSRQIVDKVAKLVRPAKAGHAGTLDPLATGVLVVAVGPATRLITHLQQGRKRYVGQFRLGQRSDTDDAEGQIVPGGDWTDISEADLVAAASQFTGVVSQIPPQFSAVHVDGKRAYALARKGEVVDLQARDVEVFSLQVTRFEPPDFELTIECGSGTYIRSIGRDLGGQLGCGALMTALQRTAVGPFTLEDAVRFEDLDHDRLKQTLQPALHAVADRPRRIVDSDEQRALRQGRTIPIGSLTEPPNSTSLSWAGLTVHCDEPTAPATVALVPGADVQPKVEVALIDSGGILIGMAKLEFEKRRLQPEIMFPPRE